MAERSKAKFCGRSLAGIAGSNAAEGIEICLLFCVCVCVCVCDGPIPPPEKFDCDVSLCVSRNLKNEAPSPALGCCA